MKNKLHLIAVLVLCCSFGLNRAYGQCPGTAASLPYSTGFETAWINDCASTDNDIPDTHWANNEPTALSATTPGWRRSDYTTWGATGIYSPTGQAGSYSARFHSTNSSGSTSGNLDLYLNCLTSPGTQQLTFNYINTAGSDNVGIFVSTDGGTTFPVQLGTLVSSGGGWAPETYTFTSSSATTIIRFIGSSVQGSNGSTDIGIDNVTVATLQNCSGTPAASTVNPANPALLSCSPTQTFSLSTNYAGIVGISYQWQTNTGSGFSAVSGQTNATYTGTFALGTTYVNCIITCANGPASTTTPGDTVTVGVGTQPYLTIVPGTPYTMGFENQWANGCGTDALPDQYWVNTPVVSNDAWRRDDDGASAGEQGLTYSNLFNTTFNGAYNTSQSTQQPTGSNAAGGSSSHSARFHGVGDGYSGGAAGDSATLDLYLDLHLASTESISYDFINCGDALGMQVLLSTDGGTSFSQISSIVTASTWTRTTVNIATSSSTCILRFKCKSNIDYDKGLDNVTVTALTACSGTPSAIITPHNPVIPACASSQAFALSPNLSGISGLTYQWRTSTDGVAFTSVSGATTLAYTATLSQNITYVNCAITCTNSSLSDTTALDTATIGFHYFPVAVATPYNEGFENTWTNACSTHDIPDSNWINTPATGDPSWRRDDDGTSAAWDYADYGTENFSFEGSAYVINSITQPTGSNANGASSSHSARYHAMYNPAAGNLYLYLNLGSGTKQISYDYINNGVGGKVTVALSTTGPGGTFTTISGLTSGTAAIGWTTLTATTTASGPNCVLRFQGTSVVNQSGDIGIDNVSVIQLVACAGAPPSGVISPISPNLTSCNASQFFTLSGLTGITGLGYQWQQSTNGGATFSNITNATNNSYTASSFASGNTLLNCIVKCTATGDSTLTDTATLHYTPHTYLPVTVANPYLQNFENFWLSICNVDDAPDNNWLNNPASGNNSWRREDDGGSTWYPYPDPGVGIDNVSGAPLGSHSATFNSAYTTGTGNLDLYLDLSATGNKQISFDYIKPEAGQTITVLLSTTGPTGTFTSLGTAATSTTWATKTFITAASTGTCVLRFQGKGADGSVGFGIDNVSVYVQSACSGSPVAPVLTPASVSINGCNNGNNTATFSFVGGYNYGAGVTGLAYQWQQSTNGGISYTAINNATNNTYTGTFGVGETIVNCLVTCTNGGAVTPSDSVVVINTPQSYLPVTAGNPYIQGFENTWLSKCNIDDAPDAYSLSTPSSGNNSWRRNDDGGSGGWTSPNSYTSTATGSTLNGATGTYYARIHSATVTTSGTLDFYLDMGTVATAQISFDYINTSGTDNLGVFISTTGPTGTFTQLGSTLVTSASWATTTLTTTLTSGTCVLRFKATGDNGSTDIGIDNITVLGLVACSGTPPATTVTPATANVTSCSSSQTLALSGIAGITGLVYQWQQSLDGTNYTVITGATNNTYTGAFIQPTTYVNCVIGCVASNSSSTSSAAVITNTTPQSYFAVTVGNPYTTGFENTWLSSCGTHDIPDSYWSNQYATGNQSWRRDDDGTTASWTAATYGVPSPAYSTLNGATGTHSARFHVYAPSGTSGYLDLHLDLSAAGTKNISFDFNNVSTGGMKLQVFLSTNGGTSFVQLGSNYSTQATWATKTLSTTLGGSQCVLRFTATSDYDNNDIDIDNVSVTLLPNCSIPTAGLVTPQTPTLYACGSTQSQLLTLSGASSPALTGGITYQWQQSTDGVNYTSITNATTTTYTAALTAPLTYLNCVVGCSVSGLSAISDTVTATLVPLSYAPLPYTQNFDNAWANTCGSIDNDAPDAYWVNAVPGTIANNVVGWRRNDYATWTSGAYSPTFQSGTNSARFHSAGVTTAKTSTFDLYVNCSAIPGLQNLSFYYLNTAGADHVVVSVSTTGPGGTFTQIGNFVTAAAWTLESIDFTSTSATTIIRFTGTTTTAANTSDIGIDNLSVTSYPACTGAPAASVVSPLTASLSQCTTTAQTFTLTGLPVQNGFTYQWMRSNDGVTFTAVSGATTTSYAGTGFIAPTTKVYCNVTCTNSGQSTPSDTAVITNTQAYASLPYTQNFESTWTNTCGSTNADAPDLDWENSLITAITNTAAGWRRNDYATWTTGAYTPAAQSGTYSARFHTASVTTAQNQKLDLYVNCSTGTGLVHLTFYYLNTAGGDSLTVSYSADGGATFTVAGHYLNAASWTLESLDIPSSSATTVIRFAGQSTTATNSTDIGLDNINMLAYPACTGVPTAGVITPSNPSLSPCTSISQTLTLTGLPTQTGYAYQWMQSTNGVNYTAVTGATNSTYTGVYTGATTYIYSNVTCTNSSQSTPSNIDTVTNLAVYASLPYTQDFESWTSTCGSADATLPAGSSDAPDIYWINSAPAAITNAVQGWRRDDYVTWTTGAYSPLAYSNTYSARFHSKGISATKNGNLDLYLNCATNSGQQLATFYYLNDGSDSMTVFLSTNGGGTFTRLANYGNVSAVWTQESLTFASSSPTTILRFTGYTGSSTSNGINDIGLDNLNIANIPVCSGAPTPGTVSSSAPNACATTSITLTLTGTTVATGLTYQWQSSTDGISFYPIVGATTSTYTLISPQTVSTYYNCVVSCGGNSATSNTQFIKEISCYCTPTFQATCINYISTLSGGGLNFTGSSCTAVNTAQSPTVTAGSPTSFTFNIHNGDAGIPKGVAVYIDYNNDGTFTDVGDLVFNQYDATGNVASFPFALTVPTAVATGSYRMRVILAEYTDGVMSTTYGTGPCGSYTFYGNYQDFTVNVHGSSLTTSVSSLSAFNADACGTSASQSFTLSGTALSPSTGNISVTAPAGFLLSSNGGLSWNSSLSENYNGNNLSAAPISVEFDPTVAGTTSGNITFSGGGVNTTPTVTVSGTGNGLTISSFTVSLGNATVGVPSPGVADTLRGYGLTAGVDTVKSSNPDFQVSPDNLTWGSSYTFNVSTSSLSATPVYIRVTPGASGPETSTISFSTQFGAACTPTVTASATGAAACTTPATPTNMLYSGYSATGVTVTVTPTGTPDGYILIKSITPFTGSTTNGVTYAVGANLSNGTVIANTASTTIPVTGLTGNSTYYFTVIPYNGGATGNCGGGPLYGAQPQLSTSATTCIGTPATPTASNVSAGGFTVNWAAPTTGNGGASTLKYAVEVSTNSTFLADITGFPDTVLGGITSLAVTGLNASSTYYYRVTAFTTSTNCTSTPSAFGTQATSACTNAIWLGTTSNDWSNFNNWSCGAVPNIASAVTIPASVPNMPSISSGTFSVASFSLASNTTLNLASGATLNVAGNVSDSSTVSGAGTVVLNGTGSTQVLTGNGSINNLTVSHAATVASGANMNITGTLTMTSGVLTTNGGLQLASTASGTARIATITGGSISGTVKVQQYIPGGRRGFRFLGHPLSASIPLSQLEANMDITGQGGNANGFTNSNTNNPSAFWFNPAIGDTITVGYNTGWVPFTSTNGAGANAWNAKEGIRILVRGTPGQGLNGSNYTPGAVTLNMNGPVNQGAITETMQAYDSVNGDNSTYNLLSNPYPSPTDIGTVIQSAGAAISGAAFWVWDINQQLAGAYVPQPISNGAYYLPANASFTVSAAVNNSTLSFAETNKGATANASLFKVTNMNNGITLHLYDSNMHSWDVVYVSFNNNAADSMENYDATHLNNTDLDFYSLSSNNRKLSIDARPYATGQVVPLGLTTDVPQKYIIKAEDFTLPSNEEVYLHDKYLNQYQQLQDGSQYTFSITSDPASQGNNRFELNMAGNTTGVNNVSGSNGLKVSMVPNPATEQVTISYEAPRSEKTSVRILNMAGQQIINMELGDEQKGSVTIPLHNVASGMYMVELISGSQIVTQRLVKQ